MCRRLREFLGLEGGLDLSEEGIEYPRHVSTEQRSGQALASSPPNHSPHRTTIFLSSPFSNPDWYLSLTLYASLGR